MYLKYKKALYKANTKQINGIKYKLLINDLYYLFKIF